MCVCERARASESESFVRKQKRQGGGNTGHGRRQGGTNELRDTHRETYTGTHIDTGTDIDTDMDTGNQTQAQTHTHTRRLASTALHLIL